MLFGLKNAPSTFQRMMNHVLRDHLGKICLVYLDDIIVYSKNREDHLKHLSIIFETLKRANLKVSLCKSDFFQTEVEFLGHIINQNGLKPNPTKLLAIRDFPIPKTVKEIRTGSVTQILIKHLSLLQIPLLIFREHYQTRNRSTTQRKRNS